MSDDVTIIILGASGDLTSRLLFPALHRLMASDRLATSTRIVGYAMDDWSTEQFVAHLRDGVERFGDGVDETVWAAIEGTIRYVSGEVDLDHIGALHEFVHGSVLFYLALPPPLFAQAADALGASGYAEDTDGWRRLVVEKPFGNDSASAAALQTSLRTRWREDQILRIDHFLGKDTVQNLLVFRLANRFIEAIWNVNSIAQVQITAAETLGLEGRWRYYDNAGALRDMVQNHLMQLFALTAMEPLSVWEPEMLREHKVEVLRAVRTLSDPERDAVRGQYSAGTEAGQPVCGYTQEPNIASTSTTETYAAVRLQIDNWRWQGVPFYLRSGKRLAGHVTEIALQLRPPPSSMFPGDDTAGDGNWIVLQLRPDETISIGAVAKTAGLALSTTSIVLTATDTAARGADYSAYELLLLDAVAGDTSLFIRGDEALAAWRIVQPVLDAWTAGGAPVTYRAGGDGPVPPDGFFDFDRAWRPIAAVAENTDTVTG
jgi:glucose-6-phosphate 1-dehydrogenase